VFGAALGALLFMFVVSIVDANKSAIGCAREAAAECCTAHNVSAILIFDPSHDEKTKESVVDSHRIFRLAYCIASEQALDRFARFNRCAPNRPIPWLPLVGPFHRQVSLFPKDFGMAVFYASRRPSDVGDVELTGYNLAGLERLVIEAEMAEFSYDNVSDTQLWPLGGTLRGRVEVRRL
jgi:hypothetical protein